ncbi:MAG: hypothetical protein JXB06_01065 [Spirochaetales bacterium]|nr:hypothetical protein [Spirochaetales bacterium]
MKSLDALVRGRHGFEHWLRRLYARSGIHGDLVTIRGIDIPEMALGALGNVNSRTNPARAEVDDIEDILRRSFAVSD